MLHVQLNLGLLLTFSFLLNLIITIDGKIGILDVSFKPPGGAS